MQKKYCNVDMELESRQSRTRKKGLLKNSYLFPRLCETYFAEANIAVGRNRNSELYILCKSVNTSNTELSALIIAS